MHLCIDIRCREKGMHDISTDAERLSNIEELMADTRISLGSRNNLR